MKSFNQNPEQIARSFQQYTKALLLIVVWITVGLASLAAACVAISGIWAAVKYALSAIF